MNYLNRYKNLQNENFWKWFHGSKVVDENNEPLVVFHGTKLTSNFNKFNDLENTYKERNKPDPIYGSLSDRFLQFGNFFSSSPNTAHHYTIDYGQKTIDYIKAENEYEKSLFDYIEIKKKGVLNRKTDENEEILYKKYKDSYDNMNKYVKLLTSHQKGVIYPVYLNIKKPLIIDAEGQHWFKILPKLYNEPRLYKLNFQYDGIIIKNIIEMDDEIQTTYITFKPEQIKSVIGNNGDFNPSSKNINENMKFTVQTITDSVNLDSYSDLYPGYIKNSKEIGKNPIFTREPYVKSFESWLYLSENDSISDILLNNHKEKVINMYIHRVFIKRIPREKARQQVINYYKKDNPYWTDENTKKYNEYFDEADKWLNENEI